MTKFIKICFVFILIFVCGGFGFKLYDNNSIKQPAFLHAEYDISTTSTTTPDRYDLRDYIDIGVENQHHFGICYAFASLTSLETYLALNYGEYYDFSELHFSTSMYMQDNYYSSITESLSDGGNFSHFTLYSQKDKSIVLEQLMPMNKYHRMNNYDLTTNLESDFNEVNNNFYSLVKVNDTKSYPQYAGNKSNYSSTELETFRNSIKNHIMQYGAVTAGIHSGEGFTVNTINYRITNDSLVTNQKTINENINHLVAIVGWDDNYDANGIWENKGAYICLNSWGTDFGENGYFYVSYDDYFIETNIQGVTNATLSTTNNKISTISTYQNKTSIATHAYTENLPNTFTANIIDTSNYIGEKIKYIDSYIKGDATKFYVKFFNTKNEALAGINSTTTLISSYKIDDYTFGPKYALSSPLTIDGNYMVIVREVAYTQKYHSLCGDKSDELGIEPCYNYQGSLIGKFDITNDIWSPTVSGRSLDCTIPIILHLETNYIKVSPFDSNILSVINNKYIKNNAIFVNKSMQITLTNSNISSSDLNNIVVNKLTSSGTGEDITSHFEFDISEDVITIKMIAEATNFSGECLFTIPCKNATIYRVVEIQNVATFSINYYLDGGESSNPSIYTNKQTSLTLNAPTKEGFIFVGWYTDSELTQVFDPTSLPYTDLSLYAKYDFDCPTIVNKTNDVSITYYDGISIEINITATHKLLNEFNTLTYQWYKSSTSNGEFVIIDGATSSNLTLNSVNQSGYYACQVTININDRNIISSPYSKTLDISSSNTISVTINPYIYDMSNVKWNYVKAFSYDTNLHTVELINLPNGVSASYTNNSNSDIGTYLAHANINYDDMDGNAVAPNVEDLSWQIRKAKITITVNDIYANEQLSTEALQTMYSCQIENEYLPSNVVSTQDKISYLNLKYVLQPTSNNYLKIITVTTDTFDIYDITIINGEYRVVIYTISNNNITATNTSGFVRDCKLDAQSHQASSTTIQLLKQQGLDLVSAYDINFSYLKDDEVIVTIPLDNNQIPNGLSVYLLKNGKITKLDSNLSSNNLSFNTSEMDGTYLIVKNDIGKTSNNEMMVVIIIISIYIGLCVCVIINGIKNKNNFI